MNSKRWLAATVSGGILAVSAAFGLTGCSTATSTTDTGQVAPSQGAGAPQQFDTTKLAAALATTLGVDQSKVKTALDNALAATMPSGGPSGDPSGAPGGGAPSGAPTGAAPSGNPGSGQGGDSSTMLAAVAKSMASELDLKEATVLAALTESWSTYGPAAGAPSSQPTS
jgi:uncharacterized protein YceK